MKKLLLILFLGTLLYGGYLLYQQIGAQSPPPSDSNRSTIQIKDVTYKVDIADTDDSRSLGLSGRDRLASNEGMLFMYSKKDRYAFWMKGMKFPLDFVWIDGDEVADVTENVPMPLNDSYTPPFQPKAEVDKILEINAGEISTHQFKIGDRVVITLLKPQTRP